MPTTRQMATLDIQFSPDGTFTDYSPSGNKFYTVTIQGKEWAVGDVKGPATFEELTYIFASYANYAAPTQLSVTGVSMWAPNTAYTSGTSWVSPYPTNSIVYKCTTSGTSGSLPPVWPTTAMTTVNDGTAVWTCYKWKATQAYLLNDIITPVTNNGYYWKCTTAGSSGASEPSWNLTGTTTDGTVTWTVQGVYSFAYQYTFTPQASTQDTSKTYTFEWGEPSNVANGSAYRVVGAFFDEPGMTIDRDKLDVTSKIMARRDQPGISISPVASVNQVPLKPLVPGRTEVYYSLISFADLANMTNKMTRAFIVDLKFPKKYNTFWPLDTALPSFGGRTEAEQKPELTLTVGADTVPVVGAAWAPNTAYTLGTVIFGTGANNNRVFECSVAGTSGAAPPSWNTTSADVTTTDGTATWKYKIWKATTAYTSSPQQYVTPTVANGFVFKVSVAGTTGGTEPAWPTAHGATVVDGTVTWMAQSVDFVDPFTVDRMRRGSTVFLRVINTTTDYIGTTSIPYTFIVDMVLKVNKPFKLKDQDGSLLAVEWPCAIYYDGTATKAFSVTLKNSTPYV